MPTARADIAVGVLNGILYAIGGYDSGSIALTTVEAYDPVTDTWVTRTPMPTARGSLGVTVANGVLYAIGGSNETGMLATVEAFSPACRERAIRAR